MKITVFDGSYPNVIPHCINGLAFRFTEIITEAQLIGKSKENFKIK